MAERRSASASSCRRDRRPRRRPASAALGVGLAVLILQLSAISAAFDFAEAGTLSDQLVAGPLGVNQLSASSFDSAGGVNGEAVLCFLSSPADGSIIAAVGAQDPASTSSPYIVKARPKFQFI
eukprot:tig00021501_g21941.t1